MREWLIRVFWLVRVTGPLPGRPVLPAAEAARTLEGKVTWD